MAKSTKYPEVEVTLGGDFTPIGENEPVFILRGRDGLAVAGIRGYLTKCAEAQAPREHLEAVEAELHKWEGWQASNPDQIQQPTTAWETDEWDGEDDD